jgi:DnaJ-class molecular chaperone
MPVDTKFYDMLKVSPTASQLDIKKSYKNLARIHHPDKGGSEEKMKEINNAFEILSDETKKQLYDKFGEKGVKNGGQQQGFSDIFTQMFSNSFRPQHQPQPVQNNIEHIYNVTLEQLCRNVNVKLKYIASLLCAFCSFTVCNGCNGCGSLIKMKHIGPGMIQQIKQLCDKCKGIGKISTNCSKCTNGFVKENKIIQLSLSEKLQDKHQFRYKYAGNQIVNGELGDFIVTLNYVEHNIFTIQKSNLIIYRTISLLDAITGYKEDITHPSSRIINIDTTGDIINPYDDYTLKKMGMTSSHDLFIKFKIIFPTKLDDFKKSLT